MGGEATQGRRGQAPASVLRGPPPAQAQALASGVPPFGPQRRPALAQSPESCEPPGPLPATLRPGISPRPPSPWPATHAPGTVDAASHSTAGWVTQDGARFLYPRSGAGLHLRKAPWPLLVLSCPGSLTPICPSHQRQW